MCQQHHLSTIDVNVKMHTVAGSLEELCKGPLLEQQLAQHQQLKCKTWSERFQPGDFDNDVNSQDAVSVAS